MNNEQLKQTAFGAFLHEVEQLNVELNTTAKGETTIQQTPRNEIRRKGLDALKKDLNMLYGDDFDIVETKEGIIIVAENDPGNFTFSWELKSTIKSIDFDPFIEASNFEEEQMEKEEKKRKRQADKEERDQVIEERRKKKLAELAARRA